MSTPLRIILREDEVPRQWYNIQADLPTPLRPPLNPATGRPVQPEDLAPVFPMNLIEQEASRERYGLSLALAERPEIPFNDLINPTPPAHLRRSSTKGICTGRSIPEGVTSCQYMPRVLTT